jgi:large subunit ribosomal protein L47
LVGIDFGGIEMKLIGVLSRRLSSAIFVKQVEYTIIRHFRLTSKFYDLNEFFDDKKNWGESNVKVGRAWRVDDLRIKSNTDLHKLWFVLLKERNMLLTMEHEAKRCLELFPNPERIDKVEESMTNLEAVVRERNKAYYFLETGESGERTGEEVENFLGLQEYVQHDEYPIPKEKNKSYLQAKQAEPQSSWKEKAWFLVRWNARKRKEARMELRRQQFYVLHTLRNFPNADREALKEAYPLVDVDKYEERVLKCRHAENLRGVPLHTLHGLPWRI